MRQLVPLRYGTKSQLQIKRIIDRDEVEAEAEAAAAARPRAKRGAAGAGAKQEHAAAAAAAAPGGAGGAGAEAEAKRVKREAAVTNAAAPVSIDLTGRFAGALRTTWAAVSSALRIEPP
jgi:hypothetical protein